ncbi:hypothetical protein CLAFUW4_10763 [Fulvia fulva]|uniref:Uncharacterized protein n=1 Tax=Passalora fulva TaxID=5499 RepID=A0A9Q8LEU3_PASFU|nr:uncharacterized protein CLAFUR5_05376 [Fulvia fulva]KAK4615985.1 hypothetical protein CLAFUR4_10768 [Fulvia fulva]KAK4616549.1 hypothetical protein CLAFUR0_10775 [Fulvia fulva]UJO16099.1 hypothetical protein CLAFUR5_05376 [Fulvia fulva]WPV18752.1 hypothetical protein CLAFUW4_10763 [Fulvia fulva]WPV33738.1 hypothetical protein CLAFUW7_10765 [Fulvia fulva]
MGPEEAAQPAQYIFGRENREFVVNAQATADRIFSRRSITKSNRNQQIKAEIARRQAQGVPATIHTARPSKRRRGPDDQIDDDERDRVLRPKRRAVAQNNQVSAERRAIRKQARPRGDPKVRCWDWMLHNGDMHHARNGSAFDTYEKINEEVSTPLALGDGIKAVGIGTVRLEAK